VAAHCRSKIGKQKQQQLQQQQQVSATACDVITHERVREGHHMSKSALPEKKQMKPFVS
jgi:hypothetical protein